MKQPGFIKSPTSPIKCKTWQNLDDSEEYLSFHRSEKPNEVLVIFFYSQSRWDLNVRLQWNRYSDGWNGGTLLEYWKRR
jgi:hypothetical protein